MALATLTGGAWSGLFVIARLVSRAVEMPRSRRGMKASCHCASEWVANCAETRALTPDMR